MGASEWLLIALGALIGAAIIWATLAIRSSLQKDEPNDMETTRVTVVYKSLRDLYPDWEKAQASDNLEGALADVLNKRFGANEEE